MRIYILCIGLLAIALTGCSSFDRASAEKRLGANSFEVAQPTDSSLSKPLKLGILLDLETADSGAYRRALSWDDTEKKMVASYADSLLKEGAVSSYFFIPEQDVQPGDLNSAIAKAAAQGADALLTVRGIISVDKYMNAFGILDPTIVGALVLPGSNMDVTVLARVDLWEVKGGKKLLTAKSDGVQRSVGTTLYIRCDSAHAQNVAGDVKIETLRKLLIDFKKQFSGIRFQTAPPPYPKGELPKQSVGK